MCLELRLVLSLISQHQSENEKDVLGSDKGKGGVGQTYESDAVLWDLVQIFAAEELDVTSYFEWPTPIRPLPFGEVVACGGAGLMVHNPQFYGLGIIPYSI